MSIPLHQGGGYPQHMGEGAVMYTPGEYEQARRRPAPMRPPIPQPGDELLYRHREGSPDLYRVEVVGVQNPDSFDDPNLWYFQTDADNRPVMLEGKQVLAQAYDPWPTVRLRLLEPIPGEPFWINTQLDTREARMRGSAGWLPLDWETRPQPAPPAFVVVRNS